MDIAIYTVRAQGELRMKFGTASGSLPMISPEAVVFGVAMTVAEARELALKINSACALLDTDSVSLMRVAAPALLVLPEPQPGQEDQAKNPEGKPHA